MNLSHFLPFLPGVVVVFSSLLALHGQETQRFCVRIPSHMTVTAPTSVVVLTHDESGNDQTFAKQHWDVQANINRGVTVSFSTNQAFTNSVDATFKRDARLDLAVSSADTSAGWTIEVASDQTNHASSDELATVQARSIKPGSATFDLTVTFVADSNTPLAPPDYELEITGTLTAN
jgi:hypothetical protein